MKGSQFLHWKKIAFFFLSLLTLLLASAAPSLFSAQAPPGQANQGNYKLHVSSSANRSRAVPLEEKAVVSGNIHVFVTPPAGIARVRFFLDHPDNLLEDPLVAGTPFEVDDQPPFDFGGTGTGGGATPFDTTQLADGEHNIVAAIDLRDGTTQVEIARFIVHNAPPALLFGPEPLKFKVVEDGRSSKTLRLFVGNGRPTAVTLSDNAPWLTFEAPTPGGNGQSGTAPGLRTVSVDASGLSPGTYTATITGSAPDYTSDSQTVTMEVTAESTCSPLACSEILVDLPYQLNFSQNHGKILDANGVGTGFTYVDRPTNGTGYIAQNLAVNTASPGTFKITTTSGIMFTTANSQDNALAVGIDAPSQITVMETTLLNPPSGSGSFEQAGLWFGNDQDNYVKFEVISTPDGARIEYLMEVTGTRSSSKTTGVLNLAGASVTLSLRANPGDRSISAFYGLNGASLTNLATFTAPPEFFSFDAAGIDPNIGTRSFGGVFATHRNGSTPLTYTFDDFSVVAGAAAPRPSDISFDRTSFSVPFPTSMAWGPDNRLYVTELFGTIHALTLNENKQVVADQVITTLGQRLTLGITVDPLSTPSNVILWVSHSNPSTNNGQLNSSTITRLSGSGFTTRQDVITGLPRAIANHAVNSIHFGPDGRLYIAQGGNTGAGAANTANTEFGTRAEQPLSAALLVADVRAAGFDGSCATPENTYGPSPCDVVTYSTGLRNAYDFVWHSNGFLYAPDNGLGVTGTYPPTSSPPCEGFGDPALWTNGGDNPGEQPDILLRLQQGKYYGHPDPYRNECVFKDGSYQGVAALTNYVAPIYNLGRNKSANGTIEYKSNAFNGTLKGEILITNYSVGDDITRIRLSSDGLSVVEAKQLAGGFSNPLPITEGPDGTIYVGETGANLVTALIPKDLGTWTTKQTMPAALLDVGGTALGGKLYAVAGKTSAGPQRTMYIYDPATNSWTTGPSLPTAYAAVENPAVAAYNGKLYVFGGSTDPFSGAVTSAAVFDPQTSSWTMLASMQTARGGATAQVINGKIYVAGGLDVNGASLASVEIYDPASNTWSSAAAMTTRRDNAGSAVLGGMLYVFGGRTRDADGTEVNGTLATVEMYDPSANTWTARASMPTGRRTVVVGTLDGKAQVMGGERTSSGGSFEQNEEYDPLTNSWRTLAPMLTARHGAAAGTINGVVYVAGGGPTGGSSFSSVNEAFSFAGGTTPAPTPTNTPAPGNTPTNTPTSTATPQSTATNTPTRTPTPQSTPTNTPAPGNTPTNTPTSTATSQTTATNTPTPGGSTYTLLVSFSSNRANPVTLAGMTVSGHIYVFTSPDTNDIKRVRFFLDDPNMTGKPRQIENNAPYDFAGGTFSTANPFRTTTVADGSHTITAEVILQNGQTHVVH
ncbi:MAG TPA: kelch repeat-containing protein, partial [Anaerolineae bacterium]